VQSTLLAYPTPAPKSRNHVRSFVRAMDRAVAGAELAVEPLPLRDRCIALNIALTHAMTDWQAQQNYDRETAL